MEDLVWQPSEARIEAAALTAFRRQVKQRQARELADYAELYDWSVSEPEAFWEELWRFCDVIGDGPGSPILEHGERMPGACWFPAARLNYAENLLSGPEDGAPAIVFQGESGPRDRLSFGDLRARAAAFAAALQGAGVQPGDRVAGFLPNLPETVVAMLGAASLGAVWSSCSPDFGVQGVLDRFQQIEPTVLVCADGYFYGGKAHDSLETATLVAESLPALKQTVVVPFVAGDSLELPAGMMSWDDFISPHAGARPTYQRLPFAHPLFIMFSSGTTGLPKCMVHSAGGTLLQHLKEHRLHGDLRPGDRLFYFTTCGWMMWNWLVSGLAVGATLLLYDGHPLKPAQQLWDYAAAERCTHFGTSAKYLEMCAKEGLRPRETHDLDELRCLFSTGSPLAPESFDYVYRDIAADLQLSSISGGTDIISCFVLGNPVLPVRRGRLQCRGLGMKVDVFDAEGKPLREAKGELVCAAPFPSMPTGFWNDPDGERYRNAYFTRFPGIWCHGDFAELGLDGSMVIHGRSDTVLNPGGVRIGTAELYRIVDRFDEVLESVVVGQEHEGELRVLLFVVLREGLELDPGLEDRLRRSLRQEASPRHVPAIIRQVPAVPRTISGKIVELAVRDVIHGHKVPSTEAMANPEALEAFVRLRPTLS
ncbi:MAG: acetoacetate--CoA ligase [Planctomycetota bacterium]|nr:MAG: acetoacetate--CoA ligase [Planctomycetota bacterium]